MMTTRTYGPGQDPAGLDPAGRVCWTDPDGTPRSRGLSEPRPGRFVVVVVGVIGDDPAEVAARYAGSAPVAVVRLSDDEDDEDDTTRAAHWLLRAFPFWSAVAARIKAR